MPTHVRHPCGKLLPIGNAQLAGQGQHLRQEGFVALADVGDGLRPASRRVLDAVEPNGAGAERLVGEPLAAAVATQRQHLGLRALPLHNQCRDAFIASHLREADAQETHAATETVDLHAWLAVLAGMSHVGAVQRELSLAGQVHETWPVPGLVPDVIIVN